MIFEPVPVERAAGLILGHNVVDENGRRRLRKGTVIRNEDVAVMQTLALELVWTAQLEPGDIDEDAAALRVARSLLQPEQPESLHLDLVGPRTGRVNMRAMERGVLVVNEEPVAAVNRAEGITFATAAPFSVVDAGRTVATVKILPYALPAQTVDTALAGGDRSAPAVAVVPLVPRRVALIVSGNAGGRDKTVSGFETSLRNRLVELNASLESVEFVENVSLSRDAVTSQTVAETAVAPLAAALRRTTGEVDLVLLAGETAIQDRRDIAPTAIEAAGGTVTCFGAPVDPGNLLLLGQVQGTVVLGVPGCARSPKLNIVDLLLPRLLVKLEVAQEDIAQLGVGGLLDDVAERPLPRRLI